MWAIESLVARSAALLVVGAKNTLFSLTVNMRMRQVNLVDKTQSMNNYF